MVGSAIGRECGRGVFLHAGPEIAVASTKAMTNMAATFAMLALLLGRVRDLSSASGQRIVAGLRALPGQIEEILASEEEIAEHRPPLRRRRAHVLRRPGPRLAGGARGRPEAEGGLLRPRRGLPGGGAQARPAGADQPLDAERGHRSRRRSSVEELSTIEQIKARGGPVIAVTSADLPVGLANAVIRVPHGEPELEPMLLNVPLQLLVYRPAAKLGRDIDKPRNLAKSVTVE